MSVFLVPSVVSVEVLEQYATNLWFRHSNSTASLVSPNEKTEIEKNIIGVVQWCKKQKIILGKEKEKQDAIFEVAKELYVLLQESVETKLNKISARQHQARESNSSATATQGQKESTNVVIPKPLAPQNPNNNAASSQPRPTTVAIEKPEEKKHKTEAAAKKSEISQRDINNKAIEINTFLKTFKQQLRQHIGHLPSSQQEEFKKEVKKHTDKHFEDKALLSFLYARTYLMILSRILQRIEKVEYFVPASKKKVVEASVHDSRSSAFLNVFFVYTASFKKAIQETSTFVAVTKAQIDKLYSKDYLGRMPQIYEHFKTSTEQHNASILVTADIMSSLIPIVDEIEGSINELHRLLFEFYASTVRKLLDQQSQMFWTERGLGTDTVREEFLRQLLLTWNKHLKHFIIVDQYQTVQYPLSIREITRLIAHFESMIKARAI